jgi:hypothetical protein
MMRSILLVLAVTSGLPNTELLPACHGQTPKSEAKAAPLAGQIKGQAFVPDLVRLDGRRLTFRKGKDFFADMEISIDIAASDMEKIEGKELKYGGQKFGDPTISVAAKEGKGLPNVEFVFGSDYTLTLKITKKTAKEMEGSIDLQIKKPEKTSLVGNFKATIRKTGSEPLDAEDAPYIHGKISIKGEWKETSLAAGIVGKGSDGKNYSNLAGTSFRPKGVGSATSLTFEPQITSIAGSDQDGLVYRHTRLQPGEYLVYIRRDKVMSAWKKVAVKSGDQLEVNLEIDLSQMGSLEVTIPDAEANDPLEWSLLLVPADIEIPGVTSHYAFDVAQVKKGMKSITVKDIPAGKYKASRGKSEGEVEIKAGETAKVTLVRTDKKR